MAKKLKINDLYYIGIKNRKLIQNKSIIFLKDRRDMICGFLNIFLVRSIEKDITTT
jgi:hypothetical protein